MKKLLNKKGFTLMEMLIVVAIIVILVAISVPTFTANLDQSKKATDDANMRAAKSAAVVYNLENPIASDTDGKVYYDAEKGKIFTDKTSITGYKQVADADAAVGAVVVITVDSSTGELVFDWED